MYYNKENGNVELVRKKSERREEVVEKENICKDKEVEGVVEMMRCSLD